MPGKKIAILMVVIAAAAISAMAYYALRPGAGICGLADARAQSLCFKQAAMNENNTQLCQKISDIDLKNDCLAKVRVKNAVAEKNLTACQDLGNLMVEQTCLQKIIQADYQAADCDSVGKPELKLFCLSEKNGLAAEKTGQADLCQQIPETIKQANCLAKVKKIDLASDADKDGLNFLQEIINGTNPDKADTDGDGQPDGVEVANGYNPDGSGKLNLTIVGSNLLKCADVEEDYLRDICRSEYNGGQLDLRNCTQVRNAQLKEYCLEKQKALSSSSVK